MDTKRHETNISLSPHIGLFICTNFAVVQHSIPVISSPVIRDYTAKTKWLKYNLLVSTVARIQQLVGCSVYIHIMPQLLCTSYIQVVETL